VTTGTEPQFRILALDDEPEVLRGLSRLLGRRGFSIEAHHRPVDALAQLREDGAEFDMFLLDLNMPERHGLDVLDDIRRIDLAIPVVILTGDNRAETAVDALNRGAFNYLIKPLADADAAALTLRNACHFGRLMRRTQDLERRIGDTPKGFVGSSPAMHKVHRLIERIAATDIAVLILGESGTGKEVVARRIHELSARASSPFVALNCGAFPESIIDSELFGHERGAFTGATKTRPGVFVEADGGTLFLDEVGEIPLPVQPRLLRVLQEGEVRPVGGTGERKIDVRVLAATNVDLQAAAAAKHFREDLFYRLNVVTIRLPPLRERIEDVPLLLAHFVEKHSRAQRRPAPKVHRDALAKLLDHDWPGNVRELENAIQRALALCVGDVIMPSDLPGEEPSRTPVGAGGGAAEGSSGDPLAWTDELSFRDARKRAQDEFERAYIVRLLAKTEGNISEAARRAGLDRSNFRRILGRLDIES
jgi:DNA-binding NtrC family response regulator